MRDRCRVFCLAWRRPQSEGKSGRIPLPDALNPGFHCVRTRWIRGFITFRLARRTRIVLPTVPV
jgi:hypothetical protein